MVEEIQKTQTLEDPYVSGKHNKAADFFIGIGMVWALGVISGLIFWGLQFAFTALANYNNLLNMAVGIFSIVFILSYILPIIISLIIAKKYFPGRRLIRWGIWTCFWLPILAILIFLGACLVNPPQW
jgi:hypothetical protein